MNQLFFADAGRAEWKKVVYSSTSTTDYQESMDGAFTASQTLSVLVQVFQNEMESSSEIFSF